MGAGIVGLSTTLALRDAGIDALCFERAYPGQGQSAGETRLFRHRHADESLIDLAIAARRGWLEWEARASTELLGREGVLRFGDDVHDAFSRLRTAGVAVKLLSPTQQAEVLPGLRSPAQTALFESTAGAIRAERTIALLAGWLEKQLVRAEVFGVERLRSGCRLHTAHGSWDCDRVVLCSGTSTPALARPFGIAIPVIVRCHPRATFRTRNPHQRLAGLQDGSGAHGARVYGAPCGGGARYVLGLVGSDSDGACDQASALLTSGVAPLVRRIQRYASDAMGNLLPEGVSLRLCHTTKLGEDKDAFRVWAEDGMVAIAGNNLFKFAPALGQVLAEAVVNGKLPPSMSNGPNAAFVAAG